MKSSLAALAGDVGMGSGERTAAGGVARGSAADSGLFCWQPAMLTNSASSAIGQYAPPVILNEVKNPLNRPA
jgi:hypothetical protein